MKVPKLLRNAALFASLIAAAVPSLSVPANAAWRGGWGGWHRGWGGWRGGWGWGGVSLGLAAGALAGTALTAPYYGYGYGPYYGYSYGYPAYGYSYGYPAYGYSYRYPAYGYGYGYGPSYGYGY